MSMRQHLRRGHVTPHRPSRTPWAKTAGLSVILIALVSGGALLYVIGQSKRVPTDPTTLCPTDRPPTDVTVLLLDMSEGFSEAQTLKIRNEVARLKAGMSRLGLIEAYAVDRPGQRVTRPVLRLCNPGTGADLSRLYQNPEIARKRWDGFAKQLDAELDALLKAPPDETSPIFEAIQATALRTFNKPPYDGLPKRLIVVSDLIQNVPGQLSQYKTTVTFKDFRNWPYFARVRADLSGVGVSVVYLVRPGEPAQKWPDHYQFWEQYFVAQGAKLERLEPVYGAQ
jgi:hypothetical protein